MPTYNFPYDPTNGNPLQTQAIFLGVASANAGVPVLQVSTTNAITATTTPLSADSSKVSAIQGDAGLLHTSAYASDAGLFRVSAIGGTAGDRTLVDGTTQTISATLTPVSASPAGSVAGLVTNDQSYDAGKMHVSSFVANSLSATADNFRVSALNQDANFMHVSGFSPDGGLFRVSAVNFPLNVSGTVSAFINQGTVSAYSPDAGLFRVSAVNFPLNVSGTVSAFINQGTVSAYSPDAGLFHVSAFIDSGSVSAKSGDANNLHASAVQGDAGLLHVSAFTSTATNLPVSATQADASLLRVSSFGSVVTTNTGGASLYFTSTATASQVSTVKSTAGRLYGYHFGNPAGVDQYVQIFNTSGGATAGTDAPTLSLYVPTLGGAVMSLGTGIAFSNGIQFITTSTVAGNSVGASGVRVNFFYA